MIAWALFIGFQAVAYLCGFKAYMTGSFRWFFLALGALALTFLAGLQT